jgi:acyl-coenzyme A synthetase/AMP-(fatty) acid ligase
MTVFMNGEEPHIQDVPHWNAWNYGEDSTFYTSGTTGEPKPVVHTADTLRVVAQYNAKSFNLEKDSRALSFIPPCTIGFSSIKLLPSLEVGCDLYMEEFNPFSILDKIEEIKPTFLTLVPAMYNILKRHERWNDTDLSFLDTVLVGGDVVATGTLDEFRSKGVRQAITGWGSTEVPPCWISKVEGELRFEDMPNAMSAILHEDGELEHSWHSQNHHMTGDLFDCHKGVLKFKGRRNNMFKVKNVRVYPELIEGFAKEQGAITALCRKEQEKAVLYYSGEIDTHKVISEFKNIPHLRITEKSKLEINPLGKIIRNQEL